MIQSGTNSLPPYNLRPPHCSRKKGNHDHSQLGGKGDNTKFILLSEDIQPAKMSHRFRGGEGRIDEQVDRDPAHQLAGDARDYDWHNQQKR